MSEKKKPTSATAAFFKWLFAAAFIIAIFMSGILGGLWHGAGLYYLVLGSVAAAFMGFSGAEIAAAIRSAAGRPSSAGDLNRAAHFWESAARNAWILGVLGSAFNFIIALGRESAGIQAITNRMIQALVVGLYGLVLAVICLIPALKLRGWAERAGPERSPEEREAASDAAGRIPVLGRIFGYVLFAAVLATAGYSLISGRPQSGVLSMEKVILHWPSLLIVGGGTIALALFMGTGTGARALTLGFGMTGLICLMMGFIQALFGFVHHSIQEITAALVFIISAGSFALLGMLIVGAPLEDREVMDGRRERPGPFSRMFWVVFPLVAYIFLILAFLMVITPMTKPAGG